MLVHLSNYSMAVFWIEWCVMFLIRRVICVNILLLDVADWSLYTVDIRYVMRLLQAIHLYNKFIRFQIAWVILNSIITTVIKIVVSTLFLLAFNLILVVDTDIRVDVKVLLSESFLYFDTTTVLWNLISAFLVNLFLISWFHSKTDIRKVWIQRILWTWPLITLLTWVMLSILHKYSRCRPRLQLIILTHKI